MALAVYSWGRGEDGQLGLGDTNDQYKPVLVDALKDLKDKTLSEPDEADIFGNFWK